MSNKMPVSKPIYSLLPTEVEWGSIPYFTGIAIPMEDARILWLR
jgi:hypothetical protein